TLTTQLTFDATGSSSTQTPALCTKQPVTVATTVVNFIGAPGSTDSSTIVADDGASARPSPTTRRAPGDGLSEDGEWDTWDSHKVLWLPPAYRPKRSAATASTMAGYRVLVRTGHSHAVSSGHDLLIRSAFSV